MPRFLLILALLVTAARAQETVQPEAAGLSAEGLSLVDAAFEKMVERKGVAGAVVLVARNDKVGYFEVFGEQAPGQPMRKDTIFRIYSMSKPVTSVAALILVEEGKLALDDPVTKYVPVLAGVKVQGKQENEGIPQRTATVKDLLLHTAGFSYGFGIGPVDGRYRQAKLLESKDGKKMMRKLSALPLVREPGTKWHYSVGTDVLGRVIEVASGQALDRRGASCAWSTRPPRAVSAAPSRSSRAAAGWCRRRRTTCAFAACWSAAASWTKSASSSGKPWP